MQSPSFFKSMRRAAMFPLIAVVLLALIGAFVPAVHAFMWSDGAIALAAFAPFAIDPDLQAVAIAYRNQRLIGDLVLPRQTVMKQEYKYYIWTKEHGFTIPDTKVGRTSAPNQVEFSASNQTGSTEDFGLDDPIPKSDLDNAPDGVDPRARAVEGITDLIGLDREKRVSDLVFAAATYPTANKDTLSGSDQFSHADSSPIETIGDALDVPIVRPNIMVIGQLAWTVLRRHADIVKAVNATAGDTGMVSRAAVAELFELEEILVGQSFLNTAKRGQTPTFSRVWGKHVSLLFRDSLANPTRGSSRVTFGFTAQFGQRIAGSIEDPDIGARGGERIRVAESVDEKIVASDVGYFLEDAVA